jgi:hypothetical protein
VLLHGRKSIPGRLARDSSLRFVQQNPKRGEIVSIMVTLYYIAENFSISV